MQGDAEVSLAAMLAERNAVQVGGDTLRCLRQGRTVAPINFPALGVNDFTSDCDGVSLLLCFVSVRR